MNQHHVINCLKISAVTAVVQGEIVTSLLCPEWHHGLVSMYDNDFSV